MLLLSTATNFNAGGGMAGTAATVALLTYECIVMDFASGYDRCCTWFRGQREVLYDLAVSDTLYLWEYSIVCVLQCLAGVALLAVLSCKVRECYRQEQVRKDHTRSIGATHRDKSDIPIAVFQEDSKVEDESSKIFDLGTGQGESQLAQDTGQQATNDCDFGFHEVYAPNDDFNIGEDEKTVDYSALGGNSQHSQSLSSEADFTEVVRRSVVDPRILVGWQIALPSGEVGEIVSTVKRKFSTTKFAVELSGGVTTVLALQRGEKKGNVPFTLLQKTR
jgi:hypothetical protein